ncbi:hypothetical protein F511_08919 [Dorcoceras hygrometricum]|uniref:Uncharacterized protein n=1 Tax=Dorcoceras hygrometricum TaxID=472368 RepID=A0A2Z7AVS7_9LAMI|nr:hypothetical protein F511_08919 [Dorcoceras hygrometricum]
MAKKRKSDATRLDEVDRSMYSTFCSAASVLSQLYTQAMHQQRLSFQAGERHALEKLYDRILRQQQDGMRVMTGDILAYLQNELEYGAEEPPPSPRLTSQHHQPSQTGAIHSAHQGSPVSSNAHAAAPVGQGMRLGNSDQNKNTIFSNALSSPARRNLQQYHVTHGGHNANNASLRNNDIGLNQSRDPNPNPQSSNDSLMDMHADSPGHDSPY